ncbi:MAG: hypothetical protein Pg6C_00900 [Treponemataceae bacterium]|nr:MAG: hypothetical protein Pg6C_00900 [Treponemataceae bacterium]
MKAKHLSLAGLLAAGALACALVLAGCDNPGGGGGGDDDPPKTVAAEYRFTDTTIGFTLGKTTAVKTGDNAFSLTGVYTEGGGTYTHESAPGEERQWAYLYDNTGKRGIVCKYGGGLGKEAVLGRSAVESIGSVFDFAPSLSTADMSSSPMGTFNN